MRSGPAALLASLMSAMLPTGLVGQEVRAAMVSESYGFDQPIPLDSTSGVDGIAEFSIPVVVGFDLAERIDLVVSGGFATLRARADGDEALSLTTVLDTELRVTWDLLPQRLTAVVAGVLPTGQSPYEPSQLSLLQLATNDALGISTVAFGAGGALAVGLVGGAPWGGMAVSVAATYTTRGSYEPLAGVRESIDPGGEFRFRAGLEGPVTSTGYVRAAGAVSRRGEDVFGQTSSGGSNLWSGYVAYEHGVGDSDVSVYLYDAYRSGTSVDGGLIVPRSNSFAVGGRWRLPVRDGDAVTPKMEFRLWTAQPFGGPETLERLGGTFRIGVEYAFGFENGLGLVFNAEGLFGEIGTPVSPARAITSGLRLGIQFEKLR